MRLKDRTGERFGRLVAVKYAGDQRWLCLCDCGRERVVITQNLLKLNTTSCGCFRSESSTARGTKHGMYSTPVYKSWVSIRRRCLDPRYSSFPTYGGAGIGMYGPWQSDVVAFAAYIGVQPDDGQSYSVDRIDNAKGYEPGNVRWATDTQQARNRDWCIKIEFQGKKFQSISEFVEWLAPQVGVNKVSLTRELSTQLPKT